MGRVLAVFGISGVGKTFMAARFAAAHDARHVQASELIRLRKGTSLSLRDNILDNQSLLISAFVELRKTETKNIVFDGHSIIDGSSGLVTIPTDVIRAIEPAGLLFIRDDPINIARKRTQDKSRSRPLRTPDALEEHQAHALEICKKYGLELGLALSIVGAGDWQTFESEAVAILGK